MVCSYRVEDPVDLHERQIKRWDPLLEWFESRFGVAPEPTTGLMAGNPPEATRVAVSEYLQVAQNFKF